MNDERQIISFEGYSGQCLDNIYQSQDCRRIRYSAITENLFNNNLGICRALVPKTSNNLN